MSPLREEREVMDKGTVEASRRKKKMDLESSREREEGVRDIYIYKLSGRKREIGARAAYTLSRVRINFNE